MATSQDGAEYTISLIKNLPILINDTIRAMGYIDNPFKDLLTSEISKALVNDEEMYNSTSIDEWAYELHDISLILEGLNEKIGEMGEELEAFIEDMGLNENTSETDDDLESITE